MHAQTETVAEAQLAREASTTEKSTQSNWAEARAKHCQIEWTVDFAAETLRGFKKRRLNERVLAENATAEEKLAAGLKITQALKEATAGRGWKVEIASERLYSDDLGDVAPQDTYLGAFRSNVEVILAALR